MYFFSAHNSCYMEHINLIPSFEQMIICGLKNGVGQGKLHQPNLSWYVNFRAVQ